MHSQEDILAALDHLEAQNEAVYPTQTPLISSESFSETPFVAQDEVGEIQEGIQNESISELPQTKKNAFAKTLFLVKYFSTSAIIFASLLLVANYSAYWNIAKSVIFKQEMERTKQSLIESVAAGSLNDEPHIRVHADTFRALSDTGTTDDSLSKKHSLAAFVAKNENGSMDIEITPYENRIVIPKIGKNIPLVDITHTQVSGEDELNDIFMEELEKGVVRYPGSAKPGHEGNSFIFGHSSNFPWIKGAYNDVFALLDKLVADDEIIVYYGQEKFVYKITQKNVIKPGDVSVLKKNTPVGAKEISLMTCWPIGTTLNRLIVTGELVVAK